MIFSIRFRPVCLVLLGLTAVVSLSACFERNVETRTKEAYGRNRVTVAQEVAGQPRYEKQRDKEWRERWLQRKRELRDRRRREFEARQNVEEGLVDQRYLEKKPRRGS